jgi:hypothetical protein
VSEQDEGFLARWSRRKREVQEAEAATPPPATPTEPSTEPASAEAPPPEEAPLPPLETLGPDSDFTAFLRKGVPGSLKAAALRKAWSLDPKIRDYVGPAEYAWDFNNPASIPGFGPAIAPHAEKIITGAVEAALKEPSATAPNDKEAPASADDADAPPIQHTAAEAPAAAALPDPATPQEELARGMPTADPIAAPAEPAATASKSPAKPRHGSATPR